MNASELAEYRRRLVMRDARKRQIHNLMGFHVDVPYQGHFHAAARHWNHEPSEQNRQLDRKMEP